MEHYSKVLAELSAGGDLQLDEDLAQMPFDGSRAEEQPGCGLSVRQPVADQPGDLGLLAGELDAGLGGAFAGGLTGGSELTSGALGECLQSHRAEHLLRGAQLLARLQPSLAVQPLAIKQMRAGQLAPEAGVAEPLDRLQIQVFGAFAVAE